MTLVMFSFTAFGGNAAREIWVKAGDGGKTGSGSEADPFNAGGRDGLDKLFKTLKEKYGDNLKINFAAGTYYGTGIWHPANYWTIKGAGIDKTFFKTAPNPQETKTIGFIDGGYNGKCQKFAISDLTFDFNISKLRQANRVFFRRIENLPPVCYFYAEKLPEWQPGKRYYTDMRELFKNAVLYKGVEYIAVCKDTKKTPPPENPAWRRMYPVSPALLDAWKAAAAYAKGQAVSRGGKGWIALKKNKSVRPGSNKNIWAEVRTDMPDPKIYTKAVFIVSKPPLGNHRIVRVKALNCNGNRLHGFEDFVFGLGGDNCLIKDCIVEKFYGTYASLIIICYGSNNRVSGCKVYGNGSCFAYGGWGCMDTVFENNYAENVSYAVNIDSLVNRNVTFRNNVFKKCNRVGILVNVDGQKYGGFLGSLAMLHNGKPVNMNTKTMEGLLIEKNQIEMVDGAPFGGIQVQEQGLISAIVRDNRLTKTPGNRKVRAIGAYHGKKVEVLNNICDRGMFLKIDNVKNKVVKGNRFPDGKPMSAPGKSPRARIDIVATPGTTLKFKALSPDAKAYYPGWGKKENHPARILFLSRPLGGSWEPASISFTPDKDCTVSLILLGQYPPKDPATGKLAPLWVCFDDLKVDSGIVLKNPGFEQRKLGWIGKNAGQFLTNRDKAFSGNTYICVWLDIPLAQRFKVKKGQKVTVTVQVRAADKDEYSSVRQ